MIGSCHIHSRELFGQRLAKTNEIAAAESEGHLGSQVANQPLTLSCFVIVGDFVRNIGLFELQNIVESWIDLKNFSPSNAG